jgi:hypothetical protein
MKCVFQAGVGAKNIHIAQHWEARTKGVSRCAGYKKLPCIVKANMKRSLISWFIDSAPMAGSLVGNHEFSCSLGTNKGWVPAATRTPEANILARRIQFEMRENQAKIYSYNIRLGMPCRFSTGWCFLSNYCAMNRWNATADSRIKFRLGPRVTRYWTKAWYPAWNSTDMTKTMFRTWAGMKRFLWLGVKLLTTSIPAEYSSS